jgi:hypothetical protein
MKGSAENRASDTPEQGGRREVVLNLGTARRMLPLVARIVADFLGLQRRRLELVLEQEELDRQRHSLAWPQRQRRYQVHEEGAEITRQLAHTRGELEQLGVVLTEPHEGRIGFPTVVNKSLAFFSWKPGDEGLRYWHFAGETVRRTIPAAWKDAGDVRLLGKS